MVKLTSSDYKKLRTRKRRRAEYKYKHHLKNLNQAAGYWGYYPTVPVDKNGYMVGWIEESKGHKIAYYKRTYSSNGRKGAHHFCKMQSNRAVRKFVSRYAGRINKGCSYRKYWDKSHWI